MAPPLVSRVGGSFAPPLTDEILEEYEDLIHAMPQRSPERSVCEDLLRCCQAWWDAPESKGLKARPHGSGIGTIVDMDPEIVEELWDHVPWDHELDAMAGILENLPDGLSKTETTTKTTQRRVIRDGVTSMQEVEVPVPVVLDGKAKATRDMAFHLFWHARELARDREPITSDKIGL